ncbi:hypothetical protein WJX73_005052 [Symbiochloris irregularis]|uniref:Nuclear pore complex protein Nup85 n=1 Tax=Symbiochloris irregularis TaxID=706552 RepID=A0AAW1NZJ6_9CHLO
MHSQLADAIGYCKGWADRHVYFEARFRSGDIPAFNVPSPDLFSPLCSQPLGISNAVGRADAHTCLHVAGLEATTSAPGWQELLRQCRATDHLLSQLLSQHDHALHACLVSMKEYTAWLKLVVPADYATLAALSARAAEQGPLADMSSAAHQAYTALRQQIQADGNQNGSAWLAALGTFLGAVQSALNQDAHSWDMLSSLGRVICCSSIRMETASIWRSSYGCV